MTSDAVRLVLCHYLSEISETWPEVPSGFTATAHWRLQLVPRKFRGSWRVAFRAGALCSWQAARRRNNILS